MTSRGQLRGQPCINQHTGGEAIKQPLRAGTQAHTDVHRSYIDWHVGCTEIGTQAYSQPYIHIVLQTQTGHPLSHHTDQGWPLNWRWRLFLFVHLFIVYLFGRGTREPHCTMGVGGVTSSYLVCGLHLGHCALWQATETFHLPKEDVWVCLFVCFLMA